MKGKIKRLEEYYLIALKDPEHFDLLPKPTVKVMFGQNCSIVTTAQEKANMENIGYSRNNPRTILNLLLSMPIIVF